MSRRICRIAPLLLIGASLAFAEEPAGQPKPASEPVAVEAPESAVPAPAEPAPTAKPAITAADLSLSQLAVCTGVENRTPVGEASSFDLSVGMLYCFTHVQGGPAPAQIYHRWYVGDRLAAEIPIQVRASGWRCWSAKTIRPGMTGPCRVEIVTEEGDVLGTKEFTLGGAPAQPASEG